MKRQLLEKCILNYICLDEPMSKDEMVWFQNTIEQAHKDVDEFFNSIITKALLDHVRG